MGQDLANYSVDYALKKGASYAESRFENTKSHSLILKNGNLDASSFSTYEGLGMRFLVKNKLGFVSLNQLSKRNVRESVDRALRRAKNFGKYGEEVLLSEDPATKEKYEVKQKINLEDVGIDGRIKLLREAERGLKDSKVNVPSRIVVYGDDDTTEHLVNSDGTEITAKVPKVNFYYFLTIVENNKVAQRYESFGGTGGFEVAKKWNMAKLLNDDALAIKNNLTKGVKLKSGKMPIICGSEVTGIMVHESVGHPYEADRIFGRESAQAGESFVTPDMVGHQIGSELVNVVDNPLVPKSYGYYKYDNEGVKARKKVLIKDGVITEFLHNRETAYHMGLKSNGSSRATDYDKESIVRMSNTYMLKGKSTEEEVLDVKKGVYIKNFMEWNIDDKRLNQKYTGAEAYLIENGEITKPVISPVIEVATPNLWKAVDAVGNKERLFAGNCGKGEPMQGIPVLMGGPMMRLKGLRVK
jgi:TldD protein